MIQQTKAKMFLAEDRGINETSHFRSLHTFNFGNYFNPHKTPFNNLYVINDDTLGGGRQLSMLVQAYSYVILLPVVGAINYKDSYGNEHLIAAGQVQISHIDKGVMIEITNPFKEHFVNFLQIWIKAGPGPAPVNPLCLPDTYNINERTDNLIRISPEPIDKPALPFITSIGKFNGRAETCYSPQHQNALLFIFILEGAFEVNGRLLHARDGLALWETTIVEMEALSNDAIVLLIETTGNNSICNRAGYD